MKLLLDTHTLVWWLNDDGRLSNMVRQVVGSPDSDCLVSAASAWEVATKVRRKRWPQAEVLSSDFKAIVTRFGFQLIGITADHALAAGKFDADHQDPFDRMLAAQTLIEDATLVTFDPAFVQFDIRTVW